MRVIISNCNQDESRREAYDLLGKLINKLISAISILYIYEGFEKGLSLKACDGVFLISGFDSKADLLYILREDLSVIEGRYEIEGDIWSGIYLTREIEKVRKACVAFIEEEVFDSDVLVESS